MDKRPAVSVVIPVYNTGEHLRECLDSVLGQTLGDLEVICVDDGSTDESPGILRDYAQRDRRVTSRSQERAGAGAARNAGLDAASGEHLLFLDADDFVEPTMLEAMHAASVRESADLCICAAQLFDATTGLLSPVDAPLRIELLPQGRPFSYRDALDSIFAFTSPVAWNKLVRSAFVREHSIRFQEIERTNDYLFTRRALVEADRIAIVDEPLVNYRVGTGSNLQASNHEAPLEFLKALRALKEALIESGVFAEIDRAFVNDALTICLYNLGSLSTDVSFRTVYSALREGVFAELGIEAHAREYFFSEYYYDQYLRIRELSPEDYLGERRASRTL